VGGACQGATLKLSGGSVGSAPNFGIFQSSEPAALYVTSDGRVGVSTGNPTYLLHVATNPGQAGTIMAVSTGTSDLFWVAGDGAHATKFYGDGSALTGTGETYTADGLTLQLAGGQFSALNSSVTLQGNSFNGAGELVRLTGSGYLPALDASLLTNVSSAQFGLVATATTTIAGDLSGEITNRGNADNALSDRLDSVVLGTTAINIDLQGYKAQVQASTDALAGALSGVAVSTGAFQLSLNSVIESTGALAASLAGKAGTGANTFTGVQTYGSGASITAADSPGVTISTGLFVNGAAVFPESGVTLVADGATLIPDRTFMKLAGNGGPVTLNAVTGIAAGVSGQVVILAGTSNTDTVKLTNDGNLQLLGGVPYTLADSGMITLMYNGLKWVELNGR